MNSNTEHIQHSSNMGLQSNVLNSQFRNSEDTSQMRQIKLNYNNQEYPTRQNRVQSMNMPLAMSPLSSANQNSQNRIKKVFIYTGEENQVDSRQTTTASPSLNKITIPNADQYTSPIMQGRSTTAKGILKSNKQTPSSNLNGDLLNQQNSREKNISLSFTSADEEQRRQNSMNSRYDLNNISVLSKEDNSLQQQLINQRKTSMQYKQFRNPSLNQHDALNNSFSVQLPPLQKQQSISSNEGAHSDQTHNKTNTGYRKNSSQLLQYTTYGSQYIMRSSDKYDNKRQLNASVDLSTSNSGMSEGNTTAMTQIRQNMSELMHSPLRDKVKSSQFTHKESHSHNYTDFRATNQKFRLNNNGSFLEQNQSYKSPDHISEDGKVNEQKDHKPSSFLHSQSYLRKRFQSIDNQKPQGSLPNINEEVNEDAPLSFKESNLTSEEVNRKKQMLLERLKKGSTPNKFHYDEHYDNQKLEDKFYDPSSISIHHPSRNLYDHKNPLRAYQARSNIPLANQRIATDPSTYTHQIYYKSNQKRQKDQEKVIHLLEEQDKIMNRIINKYQVRAQQEENNLKMKLQELEKDRDSLVKLKEQEQMLGLMHLNLNHKVESFKKNMSFYNNAMAPNMPALRPNMENAFTDMQDLAFLDSILKQTTLKDHKKRTLNRNTSKLRNKSPITCNYNNKVI